MIDAPMEIVNELDFLSAQRQLLEFAKLLHSKLPNGTNGKQLLKFAGSLAPEDADEMRSIIEDGCEKINAGDW